MSSLRRWWRNTFDVRSGEWARTICMALYFFFVLCAVHVLKPVAWSFFLNRFSIENLPYLYMLIAVFGGLMAYFYTKLAVRVSLYAAVGVSTLVMMVSLFGLWRVIDLESTWLLYIFAVWVNLFGIVFISQGWLIAGNLFDGREAKRLYGLLGLGAIVGAAAGGGITTVAAEQSGSRVLIPIGIIVIALAFGALSAAARAEQARTGLAPRRRFRRRPKETEEEEVAADFTLRDVLLAVGRHRHLLVIVGIIITTYLVEVLVEFQFNVFAKSRFSGDDLTAFFGRFNGIYLSSATFVLQFFFTAIAVGRLGVGRTLLISPLVVSAGCAGVLIAPAMLSVAATRLLEASSRYSISRTALELLYLPLPTELKNRTKAFVDVFVDRLGRGVAALLLVALTTLGLNAGRPLSLLILLFAAGWVALAIIARKEYTETVRRRVESKRLDLEDARITVQDTETVRLLEQAARGSNERQVVYALSLLAEAPHYDLPPLLEELAGSESETIRAKTYRLARHGGYRGLLDRALAEIREADHPRDTLAREAVKYVMALSEQNGELAAEFIEHPCSAVGEAALSALAGDRKRAQELVSREWLEKASKDESSSRRALAAYAVGIRGDKGTEALHRLLGDEDLRVVAAACRSAGRLRNRDYFAEVVPLVANPKVRGQAIEALASYGAEICESLGAMLRDPSVPVSIRQRIPRVFCGIPEQSCVDVLSRSLGEPDLTIRGAVLRALGHLRDTAADLDFADSNVREQIRFEARSYFELYAALSRFRQADPGGKATALLARTVEERLDQIIERLFRLLGLRYPPKQIQAAYLAVSQKRKEEFAAALEFLDNLLDNDLRSILLPVIDGSPHLLDIGDEHFGVKVPSLESALRQQLDLQDAWLSACAVAAVGELKLRSMRDRVGELAESGDPVLSPVARQTATALA